MGNFTHIQTYVCESTALALYGNEVNLIAISFKCLRSVDLEGWEMVQGRKPGYKTKDDERNHLYSHLHSHRSLTYANIPSFFILILFHPFIINYVKVIIGVRVLIFLFFFIRGNGMEMNEWNMIKIFHHFIRI